MSPRHEHKKSWLHVLLCKKHHTEDEDKYGVDEEEEPEETDPNEKSSVSNKEVRRHVAAEGALDNITTTVIQMAGAGFFLCLLISGVTTIIPNVIPADVPVVIVWLFQGVLVCVGFVMMARAFIHYDADSKLLMLSVLMPLLSSDKKMFGSGFSRKHRWHDAWTAFWTRALALIGLNGGWIAGAALMGWLNGSKSAIGNPIIDFQGVGPYNRLQVAGMIGFGYAFTYYTFGAAKMITSNGHIRKWIDMLKLDETPEAGAVVEFALMSTVQYMFNMALTGSPLQFELLIAGAVLTQEDDNYDLWFGAQLLGLFIAFLLLFFGHHSWGHYMRKATHASWP